MAHMKKTVGGIALKRTVGGWARSLYGYTVHFRPLTGRYNRRTNGWRWHIQGVLGQGGSSGRLLDAVIEGQQAAYELKRKRVS